MQQSTSRILTTHTGSLPRPEDIVNMLDEREAGVLEDVGMFEACLREAVAECVRKQQDAGIDVMSDGEMSKIRFGTYVKDRLTGFEGEESPSLDWADLRDYAITLPGRSQPAHRPLRSSPSCNRHVTYRGQAMLAQDIANLQEALRNISPEDVFLPAASPGVLALFMRNQYYPTEEAYLYALADAMKQEFNAIYQAGFILQLDCPDLAGARHILFADEPLEAFRDYVSLHIDVLNHAVADIPQDRVRLHLC